MNIKNSIQESLFEKEFWQDKSNHILFNPRYLNGRFENQEKFILNKLDELKIDSHIGVFSSGSTQESSSGKKLILISKKSILNSAKSINDIFLICEKDVWLNPLPFFHVGGFSIYARAYLSKSRVISFKSKWNPKEFLKKLTEFQVTISSLVPTQLFDIVNLGLKPPDTLSQIFIGGGQTSHSLFSKAVALGWPIRLTYGMTEASSQVATSDLLQKELKVLPHIKIDIKDKSIFIKGNSMFSGYFWIQGSHIDYRAFDSEWFATQDYGSISSGGSIENQIVLNITGRDLDFLKVMGENIYLPSLEEKIKNFFIKTQLDLDFVVVGIFDKRKENILCLLANKNVPIEVIKTLNSEIVMPFERIGLIAQTAKIERSPLGKLKRLVYSDYVKEAQTLLVQ